MPAIKRLVTDTLACTPKMIMGTEGGMMGDKILPAAISPVLLSLLYPALTIIGMRIAPSAAVDATADPTMLAKRRIARMDTYPSPPLTCPTMALAALTIRLVIPPLFINSPANMKKGTAIMENESAPENRFWDRI